MTTQEDAATPPPRRAHRHPLRRLGVALWAVGLALPVLLVALVAIGLSGRVVPLPGWAEDRLRDRIEAAMGPGAVEIGEVGATLAGGPALHLGDIVVRDSEAERARFDALVVSLDPAAALRGRVQPLRVMLDGVRVAAIRGADGRLDFSLADDGTARPEVSVAETLARLDRMLSQPMMASLAEVTARDAVVVVTDAATGASLTLGGGSLSLIRDEAGLILDFSAGLGGGLVTASALRDPETGEIDLFARLEAVDLSAFDGLAGGADLPAIAVTAEIGTRLSREGVPGTVSARIEAEPGSLALAGWSTRLDWAEASLRVDPATRRVWIDAASIGGAPGSADLRGHVDLPAGARPVAQLDLSNMLVAPTDFWPGGQRLGGAALTLRLDPSAGSLEIAEATAWRDDMALTAWGEVGLNDGLTLALDATAERLTPGQILPFWPPDAIPNTRDWVAENVEAGHLEDVFAAIRIDEPDAEPRLSIGATIREARIRFVRLMPPLTGVEGHFAISFPRFTATISDGRIIPEGGAPVVLRTSTMVIEDVRPRSPDATFALDLSGPVRSVLALIDAPPLEALRQLPQGIDIVQDGSLAGRARLVVPLIEDLAPEDVDWEAAGTLAGVRTETAVPGRPITADRLAFEADPATLTLAGQAQIDGVPLSGVYSQALGPDAGGAAEVTADLRVTPEVLDRFGIALPPGMLRGAGPAQVTVALARDAAPQLVATSTLQGLAFAVPALGWQSPEGAVGALRVEAVLGDVPEVPALSLAVSGLSLRGAVEMAAPDRLQQVRIDSLTIDDWLDVGGALVAEGQGLAVQVDRGSMDLRTAPGDLGGGDDAAGDTGRMRVRLDRFQISDGIALTGLRAHIESTDGLSGPFTALINDTAEVRGTMQATGTGTAIRVVSEDGGAILRATGILQSAYGGALDLTLQPTGATGTYLGQIEIDGMRVRDAPALAELLNAISVVGILDQLNAEGINLGDLEATFRLTPRAVEITEGSAVGPSLGISMDGVYDINAGTLDMQGVVSPLYIVNGLLGGLFAPRREGLFGFSYRLTGAAADPSVAVNPLSILTPGIFREIFRRPPPEIQ